MGRTLRTPEELIRIAFIDGFREAIKYVKEPEARSTMELIAQSMERIVPVFKDKEKE